MDINEKLASFQDMVLDSNGLSLWIFDGEGTFVESNCPYEFIFKSILAYGKQFQYLADVKEHVPVLLTSEYGLAWMAARQWEGETCMAYYIVGPLLLSQSNPEEMERRYRELEIQGRSTKKWRQGFIEAIRNLTVLTTPIVLQYTLILHYCVTGERLSVSSIHFQEDVNSDKLIIQKQGSSLAQAYRNQSAMMQMVREGDTNYASVWSRVQKAAVVPSYTSDGLCNAKISCTMLTSLCVRAAVEGGLSAELSYGLGNRYIGEIWQSHSLSGVSAAKNRMYEEFVSRVRQLHKSQQYSPVVRNCVDFIEYHTEEKLNIEIVAERLSYTKYYLSRRFKAEVGYSVNEYIKIAKVEHAKTLLATSNDSIDDIAERLKFASRSYFSDTFKKITGMSATQYRAENFRY